MSKVFFGLSDLHFFPVENSDALDVFPKMDELSPEMELSRKQWKAVHKILRI